MFIYLNNNDQFCLIFLMSNADDGIFFQKSISDDNPINIHIKLNIIEQD